MYRMYNKRTIVVKKSINVRVDDYLPPTDSLKLEDPLIGSLHEEGNILNMPKDAPPLSDRGRGTVSIDVQTFPKSEHLVTEDIRTTDDTQQHQNDQNTIKKTYILARKPSRKIRKNHPASNIIGDLEANVWT